MADQSSKQLLEDIRARNDIVETIGRYVQLKRQGQRHLGLCPFHQEKTPSFHVNPQRQIFHCFGCGAGGDVFSFIQRIENVSFPESIQMLAERVGLSYEFNREERPKDGIDKNTLFQVHEALAAYYYDALEQAKPDHFARRYIIERDLEDARASFQLGWAPQDTDQLLHWAAAQKITLPALEKCGVLIKNERGSGYYDRFKGRLMFPIRDEQNRVVAFSGRILDQSSPAKYVNSPETPLFTKGRVLYGLHRARQAMVNQRQAIVCEGQIDTLRLQLAGFENTVAPQGTALTEMHAALLKRYADEIILLFDADTAGQNAALRAGEALLQAGLSIRIAPMPQGEDPDSLIRASGAEAMKQILDNAVSLVTFHYGLLKNREDLSSDAGIMRASKSILEVVHHAPSAVQRERYLDEAAALLGVTADALWHDMRRMIRPSTSSAAPLTSPVKPPAHPPHEVMLIELLLSHPEITDFVHQYLPTDGIQDLICQNIIRKVLQHPEPAEINMLSELSDEPEECRRLVAEIQMNARRIQSDDEEISPLSVAQDLLLTIWRRKIEFKREQCRKQIASLPDGPAQREMMNESAQLTILLKNLQAGWTRAQPILELELD
jgi:DNA primase